MPKNRKVTKSQTGAITRSRPAHKLRIGTRKSGQSALQMSTDALKAIINSDDSRYRNNAIRALALRGIVIDWPGKLVV